jgi:hypothetical protein
LLGPCVTGAPAVTGSPISSQALMITSWKSGARWAYLWVVANDSWPSCCCTRIHPERTKRNHVRQLEALGYKVTLEPAA